MSQLRELLEDAEGRSEFVIAVVCDIRGFSTFSTIHESPDIAMFIKRFYVSLIDKYFQDARFVKPTGDGLLMVFDYTEKTLAAVAEKVIASCFSCIDEFPTIFSNDPMINFDTPDKIGFGITRGPACCLFSGKTIIDYSGHLLNLASRLMDVARPKGIVIDGKFQTATIPEKYRSLFATEQIYVRSIAESQPMQIFYTTESVEVRPSFKVPIVNHNWKPVEKKLKLRDLQTSTNLIVRLPTEPVSPDAIKLCFVHPSTLKGHSTSYRGYKFMYDRDSTGCFVRINTAAALAYKSVAKLKPNVMVSFLVEYAPKQTPLPVKKHKPVLKKS